MLVDFLVECTIFNELVEPEVTEPSKLTKGTHQNLNDAWEIYVDGWSNHEGLGARVVIISLEEIIAEHGLCLEFPTTNNEAEYEPW